jgi:hypothetical protein
MFAVNQFNRTRHIEQQTDFAPISEGEGIMELSIEYVCFSIFIIKSPFMSLTEY